MTRRFSVTERSVTELRSAAQWAKSERRDASDLVGQKEFRRRWAKYGAENTIAVTDMWRRAQRERNDARAAAQQAGSDVERLRQLAHDQPIEAIDDPARFPHLRERLASMRGEVRASGEQLEELQQTAEQELAGGREHLAQLNQDVDEKREDLQSQQAAVVTKQRWLKEMQVDNARRQAARDRLKALVDAVEREIRQ